MKRTINFVILLVCILTISGCGKGTDTMYLLGISKDLIGAPYARVEGGLAILYNHEWYLCSPEISD